MTRRSNQLRNAVVEEVLAEFDHKKELLTTFCEQTKNLLEVFLQEADLRFQSVQARVKSRTKVREKYLDPTKDYQWLDDITDQVALRIITYYEDEVDRVAEIIRREFQIDRARSVDKRETDPEKFGYYALNFVCSYSKGRLSQTEYKKFSAVSCEIQITSLLRHAWSEIEHPWYDLKDAFPSNIKRRFARMAALLEIAESEFMDLKKMQSDYRRSVAVQVAAKVSGLPVDVVSMRSFLEEDPLVIEMDISLGALLLVPVAQDLSDRSVESRSTAANLSGITTVQSVRESLARYRDGVIDFFCKCKNELWPNAKPYDLVRGTCVFYLCLMLTGARGPAEVRQFMKTLQVDTDALGGVDFDRLAAIAKEIVAKY
jgi:ppGpp synthetase/RelA/SpoT-type nucleotidyltranferase